MKNYIKKNIKVEENYINQMIKNKKPTTMRELEDILEQYVGVSAIAEPVKKDKMDLFSSKIIECHSIHCLYLTRYHFGNYHICDGLHSRILPIEICVSINNSNDNKKIKNFWEWKISNIKVSIKSVGKLYYSQFGGIFATKRKYKKDYDEKLNYGCDDFYTSYDNDLRDSPNVSRQLSSYNFYLNQEDLL